MIKYIGSKRTLIPVILETVRRAADAQSVTVEGESKSEVADAVEELLRGMSA